MTLEYHVRLLAVVDSLEFHNAVFGQLRASTSLLLSTHIVLIHLLAVSLASIRFGHAEWLYRGPGIFLV